MIQKYPIGYESSKTQQTIAFIQLYCRDKSIFSDISN